MNVRVVDAAGDPVPGLLMNMVSDNPYLQDSKGDKAATAIEFTMAIPTRVRLVVEDIEGGHVRTLIDGVMYAGPHQVVWDGTDDEGDRRHSGRYTVRMTAFEREGMGVMFEDTVDGLMCLLNPRHSPVGTTDKDGRIKLTDPRLFPHFYDREPMTATDETGEVMGALEPTSAMIFTLADTVNGGLMTFRREINGSMNLELVWNPPMKVVRRDKKAAELPQEGPPPEDVFGLRPLYPNPFN